MFYAGEGIIIYTPPAGGLPAGTVIHITNTTSIAATGADQGSARKEGSFNLSSEGDQILVYQADEVATNFISALNWDSSCWTSGDSSDKSLVPPGLIAGMHAFHVAEDFGGVANVDSAQYQGPMTGTRQDFWYNLRHAINWECRLDEMLILNSSDAPLTEPLFFQGFEDCAEDNWIIISGSLAQTDPGLSDAPAQQRVRSGFSSHQTIQAENELILSEVSVAGYHNVELRLYISSTSKTSGNGSENSDKLEVWVALNGDSFSEGANIVVTGQDNAKWSYSETGVTTSTSADTTVVAPAGGGYRDDDGDGYSRLVVSIPNTSTSVQLKLRTLNNTADEIWNVDDISLIGYITKPTLILFK